jgi:hypothetical protein
MSEKQQQFYNWILGVAAGLVLLAVSGGVIFDRDVARDVADQGARIRNIENQIDAFRIDRRAGGIYSYNDAMRELSYRDQAIKRLEDRMDKAEGGSQRGPK